MNKKRFNLMIFALYFMLLPLVCVYATDSYTNMNGVVLTKEQYNRLLQFFDEDAIATMQADTLNMIKDDMKLTVARTEKTIAIDEWRDENGNLIGIVERQVNDSNEGQVTMPSFPRSWTVTYTTTMKKLNMTVVSSSASLKIVTIKNTWLSIPSTKSYDVIAIRPASNAMTINLYNNQISGYQKYDGNMITYNASSSNTKKSSSFTGSGGIGISMNIVDSVSSSLENQMTVTFLCGNTSFIVYGTYQHAIADLTLNQSKSYSFSAGGLGNVLYYSNTTIRDKYDKMQGVYLHYVYGDELNA